MLFLVLGIPIASYSLFQRTSFSPIRALSDVIAILRPVDVRQIDDLLDEALERLLYAQISADHPRKRQQMQARIAYEYLARMAFNALVLLSWAHAEQDETERPGALRDVTRIRAIRDVIDAGVQFRFYAALAVSRLSCRLLLDTLKIKHLRKIADLRSTTGIDGVEEYERLVRAAARLAGSQRPEVQRQLLSVLRGG